MVSQVLTYPWESLDYRDAQGPQMVLRPHPGQHQELWRGDGPRAKDDLVRLDVEHLVSALDLNSAGPLPLEQDASNVDVAPDGQVEPVAVGVDVAKGGAHAYAVGIVHREGANAPGVGVVVVVRFRVARVEAGGVESLLNLRPGFPSVPPHRHRPIKAVKVVPDVGIGLRGPKEGEDVDVFPFIVAPFSPTVVIFRDTPEKYLPVDGAGPSDHLAPRDGDGLSLAA